MSLIACVIQLNPHWTPIVSQLCNLNHSDTHFKAALGFAASTWYATSVADAYLRRELFTCPSLALAHGFVLFFVAGFLC